MPALIVLMAVTLGPTGIFAKKEPTRSAREPALRAVCCCRAIHVDPAAETALSTADIRVLDR